MWLQHSITVIGINEKKYDSIVMMRDLENTEDILHVRKCKLCVEVKAILLGQAFKIAEFSIKNNAQFSNNSYFAHGAIQKTLTCLTCVCTI